MLYLQDVREATTRRPEDYYTNAGVDADVAYSSSRRCNTTTACMKILMKLLNQSLIFNIRNATSVFLHVYQFRVYIYILLLHPIIVRRVRLNIVFGTNIYRIDN